MNIISSIYGKLFPRSDVQIETGEYGFVRAKDERWSFDGRVLLNGYDVKTLIEGEQKETTFFRWLMCELDLYRKNMWERRVGDYGVFNSVVNDLMERLMYRIRNAYSEKMNGLNYQLKERAIYINGINVKAFVALFRVRPTEKARVYLKGIAQRLFLIMNKKDATTKDSHLYRAVKELYEEVGSAIRGVQTINNNPLLPSGRNPC